MFPSLKIVASLTNPGNFGIGSSLSTRSTSPYVHFKKASLLSSLQIGQNIEGEEGGSGQAWQDVKLSSDGSRVAVSNPFNQGNGINSGHVRVFEFDGSNWMQLGQDIDGVIGGNLPWNLVFCGVFIAFGIELLGINSLAFTGDWLRFVGKPELTGSWLVWGKSGSGKTSFSLQLAKYLTNFGRVAYNSLEEGVSKSLRRSMQLVKLEQVDGRFLILSEPISTLIKRLKKHKSPNIIFIDSLQYTDLNKKSYKALINQFRKKLFVIISHASGQQPADRTAIAIMFDANIKIRIEGYKATAMSRYGGGEDYIIWQQGADEYWVE